MCYTRLGAGLFGPNKIKGLRDRQHRQSRGRHLSLGTPIFLIAALTARTSERGELGSVSGGKTPSFLIRALRDPDGANLDRVQVIKGWLDAKGETHERIYDVAVSDARKIAAGGRCKQPVGNTVDVEKATYTNAIGDAALSAHWRDPDFDPKQHAFYYVRVLEIPTPRWTTYDAAYFDIERPDNVPATLQDRAYTSPIWYSP